MVEFCEPVVGFVNVGHNESHGGVKVVKIIEGQQFGGFLPGWNVVGVVVGLIGLVADCVDEFGHRVEVHDAVDSFGVELPIFRIGEAKDFLFVTPVDCAQVLDDVAVVSKAVEGGGCKFPGRFIAEESVTVVDNLHDVESLDGSLTQVRVSGNGGKITSEFITSGAPGFPCGTVVFCRPGGVFPSDTGSG